jgi:hypothetical protein
MEGCDRATMQTPPPVRNGRFDGKIFRSFPIVIAIAALPAAEPRRFLG